ncbi:Fc.00g004250.m01.CDS01 [Cosmosporella sp. VM-42]
MTSSVDSKGSPTVDDISAQENVSQKSQQARQSKNQVRHRASVACASCRDRRIRCVVPKNQSSCTACQRTGAECIIKNDDERRRPISKAYMSSLSDRISMLESMLVEKGVTPPPAAHPPKTRHDAQSQQPEDESQRRLSSARPKSDRVSPTCEVPSPPDSRNDDFAIQDSEHGESNMTSSQMLQPLAKEESPFRMLDPKQEDIVHRLLSTKGNLSFDQLSGRIRFFGPTANSHVYAETSSKFDSREPPEQVRRAERIIRSLNIDTHDYLMENFWEYYNSVLQIIDRPAFEADRESQNPKFYSSFLHITVLAMGYRVADMDRDDMKMISLGNRESTLHREAKYMLDIELERPGGIPSVVALLLLGDLECTVGRDNTGWMYSGMANRLAFDIGLHLDCRSNEMPEQESRIRRMAMRAAIIYDKYWSLFLGRPLSIKTQDVAMDLLSNRFSMLTSGLMDPPKKDMVTEVYEQLIELMELAGQICETRSNTGVNNTSDQFNMFAAGEAEDNAYLHVIKLDRQLQNWYRRLPEHLQWKPANIKTAPYSYFLLHQQYHVTMILLHRPWAKYGGILGDGASTGSHPSPEAGHNIPTEPVMHHPPLAAELSPGMGDSNATVHESRIRCTNQAIRVARIFFQHRQRFDGRKIFVTGMQHAGTAAIALIAALAYERNEADRRTYVGYLEILSDAVGDMSHTYQPASRMNDLLKAVLEQIRSSMGEPPRVRSGSTSYHGIPLNGRSAVSVNSDTSTPANPLRREAADVDFGQRFKKRRPGNSRRASEFTRQPPHFFQGHPAQLTPPSSTKGQNLARTGSHNQQNSHLDSFLFSMGVGDNSGLNFDFLGGTAIDMDPTEDAPEGGNLVLPSSETWGIDSMHSDHHMHGPGSFDAPMGEWPSGPVLGHNPPLSSSLMSGSATFGVTKEEGTVDEKDVSRSVDRSAMLKPSDMEQQPQNRGMEWMEGDAASPLNLSGLVQHNGKLSRGDNDTNGVAPRNHELDFFSFS